MSNKKPDVSLFPAAAAVWCNQSHSRSQPQHGSTLSQCMDSQHMLSDSETMSSPSINLFTTQISPCQTCSTVVTEQRRRGAHNSGAPAHFQIASTTKVLAKCTLKYYKISWCSSPGSCRAWSSRAIQGKATSKAQGEARPSSGCLPRVADPACQAASGA